jgi:hypothetical protein
MRRFRIRATVMFAAAICAPAFSALVTTAGAQPVSNDRPIGRFSNDLHQEEGVVVGSDCAPAPSAAYDPTYRPGVDAYGNPVIPAGPQANWRVDDFAVEVPYGDAQVYAGVTRRPDSESSPDCLAAPK